MNGYAVCTLTHTHTLYVLDAKKNGPFINKGEKEEMLLLLLWSRGENEGEGKTTITEVLHSVFQQQQQQMRLQQQQL